MSVNNSGYLTISPLKTLSSPGLCLAGPLVHFLIEISQIETAISVHPSSTRKTGESSQTQIYLICHGSGSCVCLNTPGLLIIGSHPHPYPVTSSLEAGCIIHWVMTAGMDVELRSTQWLWIMCARCFCSMVDYFWEQYDYSLVSLLHDCVLHFKLAC